MSDEDDNDRHLRGKVLKDADWISYYTYGTFQSLDSGMHFVRKEVAVWINKILEEVFNNKDFFIKRKPGTSSHMSPEEAPEGFYKELSKKDFIQVLFALFNYRPEEAVK